MKKQVSLLLMTYNCKEHLKRTLVSIEQQDYPNIQVCIQDSESTDGTLEVIREFEKDSKYIVSWQSVKDKGLYDGLNKSISLATGEYLQVMNDELIGTDAISKLVNVLENGLIKDTNVIGVHADLVYADEVSGRIVRRWHMGEGSIYNGWCPAHPTLMLRREVYEKYGTYATDYASASDYEYMVRILKDRNNRLAYVPETLVSMYAGGTSNQGVYNYWRSIWESLRAIRSNGIHIGLWMTFMRTIRVALQFRLGSNYERRA